MEDVQKEIDGVKTKFSEAEKTKLDIEKIAKEKGLETVTEVKDVLDKMNELHPKLKEIVVYADQKIIYNDEWDETNPAKTMKKTLDDYYNKIKTGSPLDIDLTNLKNSSTTLQTLSDIKFKQIQTKVKDDYLTKVEPIITTDISSAINNRISLPLIIKPLVEVPWKYVDINKKIKIAPDSHYNIDYILRYYEYLIENEISNDPTSPNNIYFVDFVKSVSELVRKIWAARTKGDGNGNSNFDYDGSDVLGKPSSESYFKIHYAVPNPGHIVKYSYLSINNKYGYFYLADAMNKISQKITDEYMPFYLYKRYIKKLKIKDNLGGGGHNKEEYYFAQIPLYELDLTLSPTSALTDPHYVNGLGGYDYGGSIWASHGQTPGSASTASDDELKKQFLKDRNNSSSQMFFGFNVILKNGADNKQLPEANFDDLWSFFNDHKTYIGTYNMADPKKIDALNKIFSASISTDVSGVTDLLDEGTRRWGYLYLYMKSYLGFDGILDNHGYGGALYSSISYSLSGSWNGIQFDGNPIGPTNPPETNTAARWDVLHNVLNIMAFLITKASMLTQYNPYCMQIFLGHYFYPFKHGATRIPIEFEQIETKRRAFEENKIKQSKKDMRQIEPMMEEEKQDLKQFAESYNYKKVQESLTDNVKSINQNMQSVMGFSQDAVKSLDSIDLHLITDPDILYPFGTDDQLKEIEASLVLTKSTTDIMDVDKDVDLDTGKIIVDDSDIDKPQASVLGELSLGPGEIPDPSSGKTHEDFAKSKAKSEAEKQMREAGIRICKAGDIIDLKHHKDDVMKHLRPRIILNPNYKKGGPDSDKKYLLTDRSPEAIKVVAEQISKDRAAYDKGWTDHAKSRTNVYATDAFYAKSYLGGN